MPAAVVDSARTALKIRARIGDNVWAVADQMLISGTNFVTMVLMARGLGSAADFGVFVLVYSILLFCNSLQTALVTQPHNVLGASRGKADYVRYTSSTALNQLALVFALATLVLASWGISVWVGWQDAPLLLAMSVTVIAWQLQEFMRRVLYTERRTASALAIDLLAYGGQTLAILFFWWNGSLTGTVALYAIAVTSAVAALVGGWQLRQSLALQYDFEVTKENWHFGKWLAASYIVGNWLSSQLLVFLAAGLLGTWAAGVLRAMHTVFGPMRILAQAISLTLPTKLARTLDSEGTQGFRREVRAAFLTATPLFGLYCLIIVLLSGQILTLAFGDSYQGYGGVLALHTLSAFVGYLAIVFAAVLRATRHTRQIFRCELCATLVVVPLTGALIPLLGIYGVVLGMIFTDVLLVMLFRWTYRETMAKIETQINVTRDPPPAGNLTEAGQVANGWLGSPPEPSHGESASCQLSARRRGEMLMRVFAALDRHQIPYCVLHGYDDYPEQVASDVDCILPASVLADKSWHGRLVTALSELSQHDMRVVQWFRGGAHGVVLHKKFTPDNNEFLQLDFSDGCHLNKRVLFYSGEQILESRQRLRQFWIPAAEIEFACYLIRRIAKQRLSVAHAQRLTQLFKSDPAGCGEQIQRHFGSSSAERLTQAASTGDWSGVNLNLSILRRELLRRAAAKQPARVLVNLMSGSCRRILRWFKPQGFQLVLLGPDGAGKSSVASAVQQALAPVFLGSVGGSFPPRLLNRAVGNPSQPHDIPPRSPWMSAVRAVLYWWTYYSPGYYVTVYPRLVDGCFIVHDRHVIDCLVDPIRYRYAGPAWLLRALWRWMPQPHLVVLLDVPAEILQSRKQEVTFEVSAQQRVAYRELIGGLANGKIVDGSQPMDRVVSDVSLLILERLSNRRQPTSERRRQS